MWKTPARLYSCGKSGNFYSAKRLQKLSAEMWSFSPQCFPHRFSV
jgi:hypothetical protein